MRSHYTGTPLRQAYDVEAACDKLRISMLTRPLRLAAIAALALAPVLTITTALLSAPRASADEPVITYMYPQDGDVFAEPLQVIQVCFEEPIDVRDLPPNGEGDFMFSLERPNGLRVGMRIVFQANGYGVSVYPGIVEEEIFGEWILTYTVRDRESLDPITRMVTYEVAAGGVPVITPTPQMCPADGGSPPSTDSPTAGPDGTPGSDETPGPGPGSEEGSDPDLLVISLLTIGAAAGAGLIALLGYLFRRRIGWWLHKPSEGGSSEEHR